MRRKFLPSIFLIICIIITFAAGSYIRKPAPESTQPHDESSDENNGEISDENSGESFYLIYKQIENMTIEEKIGQMLIIGTEGTQVDEITRRMIKEYKVGGFVLFGRNVKSSEQLLSLINEIKNVNSINNIPLFISVDEEGGTVSRLPSELIKAPSAHEIGKKDDIQVSYDIGSLIGEQLRAFGFNMDFAPVLDIHSNPSNPVIGDRALGTDVDTVKRHGLMEMKGLQSENIISVVKHFPGHGDTEVDSHKGLPVIMHDMERLENFELVPFLEVIKEKVDAIMIAHIQFPALDDKNPASLSKALITTILRDKFKYDGVVITDDLTMGAIVDNFEIEEAALKSINAGSDILLVCHSVQKQQKVITGLLDAVKEGRLTEKRINESIYRILSLKKKYQLEDQPSSAVDTVRLNEKAKVILKDLK